MDAKRIAEIRESAAAVVALCGSRQSAFMSASEAIALCDLAERGLAMEEAMVDEGNWLIDARRRDGGSDWKDGYQSAIRGIERRTTEILSNPKHERRG